MRAAVIALLLFRATIAPVLAEEPEGEAAMTRVNVGGKVLNLPAPYSYQNMDRLQSESTQGLYRTVPSSNNVQVIFVQEEAAELIRQGERAELDQYAIVQTNREAESQKFSRQAFARLKRQIKAGKGFEGAVQPVPAGGKNNPPGPQPDYSNTMRATVGEVQDMGLFQDDENRMGMLTVTTYNVTHNDVEDTVSMVMATNFLRLNERLVYATVFSRYASDADLDLVKTVSGQWTDQLVAANPNPVEASTPSAGETAPTAGSGFNLDFKLVAFLGGFGLLIFVAIRKIRSD